jgi:hypothetical protein
VQEAEIIRNPRRKECRNSLLVSSIPGFLKVLFFKRPVVHRSISGPIVNNV